MAMASPLIFIFFLVFLYHLPPPFTVVASTNQHFHTVAVDELIPQVQCNAEKGLYHEDREEWKLKLVDSHGPCSPFHAKGVSTNDSEQTHKEILQQDRSRVDWINASITSSSSWYNKQLSDHLFADATSIPAYSGASLGIGSFVVTVGLGTPKKDFNLAFDTGSDLTWVQCDPCVVSCYPQQGPRFGPSASSTYKILPCSAPQCTDPGLSLSKCSITRCVYGVAYGDGSYTVGYLSQDTLTLTASLVLPGFTFGCGQSNRGLFGMAGGLLGLGRSKLSVISQDENTFGGKFSYCLPAPGSPGYLIFGSDSSSNSAQFTPLLTKAQHPSFYFLAVTGISVGGQLLPIPFSIFANPGTIIDSGTVITRLPPAAYRALRSTFRSMMTKYPLSQPFHLFDTCYDLSKYTTAEIPVIKFHFQGGADLVLNVANIFYVPSQAQVCLAFIANSDQNRVAIIGNRQQRQTHISYDIPNARVGFRPGGCS